MSKLARVEKKEIEPEEEEDNTTHEDLLKEFNELLDGDAEGTFKKAMENNQNWLIRKCKEKENYMRAQFDDEKTTDWIYYGKLENCLQAYSKNDPNWSFVKSDMVAPLPIKDLAE